jgi:two-component system CheB/CheR fusion protein
MVTLQPVGPAVSTRRRVLVVEDNLDSVHSMAVLVKMMGHEVRFAINGFAALAVAREFRPHFVLLDLGLPDFDGCEIARQLRFEEPLRNTRFIAISALPAQQYSPLALKAGCDAFYSKPIDPQVLERLLGDAAAQGR